MSRKEKNTILYSRNGIKIERTDFIDMTKIFNHKDLNTLVINDVIQSLKKKEDNVEVIKGTPAWDETITRKSKLGFYYYETIHHEAKKQKVIYHNSGATFKKLVFKFSDKRYEMQYPIKCGDISINKETRPWDILPGYKGIEDHFITDLYKEVIKFFTICEDEKIKYQIRPSIYGFNGSQEAKYSEDMKWVEEVRKEVLKDLFGDENGPSINYNDIKILSHGFDLKESFRKRKENDNK